MADNTFRNPLLDDDDDEAVLTPVQPAVNPKRAAPTVAHAPKFGEKGFGKGQPKNQPGSPRARATAHDAPILAHLGQFHIGDAATLSLVTRTKASHISKGGDIPTVRSTTERLRRLKKLGLVESVRSRDDLMTLWGVTEDGIITAQRFGYLQDESAPNWSSIREMKRRAVRHHRMISLVAAQFLAGFFKNGLNIGDVSASQLVNEGQIQRAFQPFNERLQAQRKAGEGTGDFAPIRAAILVKAVSEMKARTLAPEDLLAKYPSLFTIGQASEDGSTQDVKFPDLVVTLDAGRNSMRGKNIAVEIELSKKSWDAMDVVLRTYDRETKSGLVYDRVIFGVINRQVDTLIRKVAKSAGLTLIDDGRLIITEITDRFGEPISFPETLGDFN